MESGIRSRGGKSNGVTSGDEQRTLMSKLREHYYNRKFSPEPEKANLWGALFSWGFLATVSITQSWYLIPMYHEEHQSGKFWYQCLTWFMFFETALNWTLAARKKCSVVNTERIQRALPEYRSDEVPAGWRMCFKCQLPAPERSHHCKICNACILKRDHHCFFTGACVGFWNQRHFMVWLFYVTCIGSFIMPYAVAFLDSQVRIVSYEGAYEYFLPIAFLRWCIGRYSTFTLSVITQLYLMVVCVATAAGFFLWEFLIVLRGQTSYEFLHGDSTYRTGLYTGIRNVFGPMWIVNFIWPLPVAQDGNGFQWVKVKDHKSS